MELQDKNLYDIFLKAKRVLEQDRGVSDEIKVFVHTLKMTGYDDEEIEALIGISKRTIRSIIHDPQFSSLKVQSLYDKASETLQRRLDTLSNTILASISKDDLVNASLLQKTTALSQIIDKSRLLQGKSTSNVAMAYEMVNKGKMGLDNAIENEIKMLEEEIKDQTNNCKIITVEAEAEAEAEETKVETKVEVVEDDIFG